MSTPSAWSCWWQSPQPCRQRGPAARIGRSREKDKLNRKASFPSPSLLAQVITDSHLLLFVIFKSRALLLAGGGVERNIPGLSSAWVLRWLTVRLSPSWGYRRLLSPATDFYETCRNVTVCDFYPMSKPGGGHLTVAQRRWTRVHVRAGAPVSLETGLNERQLLLMLACFFGWGVCQHWNFYGKS